MAFITAPDFRIRAINWMLSRPAQINTSGWTGRRTVVADPWHGKWRAEVELAPLEESHARAMRSFFARAKGMVNTFRLQASIGKQNNNGGVTVASTASAGATSMTISGASTPMLDGQYVTVNGQLLLLTANQSGSALNFEPPLRAQATAGTRVVTSQPYALVHLAEATAGWSADIDRVYGISFSVEEAILETDGAAPEEFADIESLDFNFATGSYTSGGLSYGSIDAVPGYSYTRSGAKLELSASGTPVAFAANVPGVISGVGYFSRQSLTNNLLRSQEFDLWAKDSGSVTSNTLAAPDGTMTADTVTTVGNFGVYQIPTTASASVNTFSVFAKLDDNPNITLAYNGFGQAVTFNLQSGTVGATLAASGYIRNCGNGWYRCTIVFTASVANGTISVTLTADNGSLSFAPSGRKVYLWQGQRLAGNLPDGGPLIVTTAAAVTIGADALSVALNNGNYVATYTFDDNSTQVVNPTTVSGNLFTLPVHATTLNRPTVKRVTMVPA